MHCVRNPLSHSLKIDKKQYNLPRSLIITPERKMYALLTSTKTKGDEILGEGGFKQVKHCLDLETGKKEALGITKKKISDTQTLYRKIINLTRDEFHIQQELSKNNPFIVAPIFIHQADNKIYYCTEKCELGSLQKQLTNPTINELSIIKNLSDSLYQIHKDGYLHLDIKPDNILLQKSKTQEPVAKFSDFGLSSLKSSQAMGYKGTAAYASPELFKAIQNKTLFKFAESTDVWALGWTFLEFLSKQNVDIYIHEQMEKNEERYKSLMKILKDPKNLAPWKQQLLEGMLQWKPEDRWSMEKVKHYLDQLK